jgi:hypothetical protein
MREVVREIHENMFVACRRIFVLIKPRMSRCRELYCDPRFEMCAKVSYTGGIVADLSAVSMPLVDCLCLPHTRSCQYVTLSNRFTGASIVVRGICAGKPYLGPPPVPDSCIKLMPVTFPLGVHPPLSALWLTGNSNVSIPSLTIPNGTAPPTKISPPPSGACQSRRASQSNGHNNTYKRSP